ncbi:glycosyltransferase family 4 protein [Aeromicrobium chenweiae]|uniref:glycosyltransferase family 4 protein n=1 Tax=Aeromicrobium chenweiae TaxID=2079793 RepID=UPI0010927146|nr:glycosyltransferase family 4 protein [Aeromicrobium chenweiae]TGN30639.1 glycosyltransferase [Aeromicrobium chenweiae]
MSDSVKILFPPTLRPEEWALAHARGDAPGSAPYGLDLLAAHDFSIEYDSARAAGRNPLTWAIGRVPRGRHHATRRTEGVAVAWDERMAVPLLRRYGDSGRSLAAGVIWATDTLADDGLSIRNTIMRRVLRQMDLVWCLSHGQVPVLRSWLGVEPERIAFLPFGIDSAFYAPAPWPDRPMVLSLGNDQDRDIPTLFSALERIRHARPDVRLVVQTRSPLPAPAGVEVMPSVTTPELVSLYAAATAVVVATQPNLHVSGMTVCLEAMATGRPAVLSRTPGASDYVLDGITGHLADPGDAADHAEAVLSILDDPRRARRLGRAAREHVVTHHDQSVMCRHLASLISDRRR